LAYRRVNLAYLLIGVRPTENFLVSVVGPDSELTTRGALEENKLVRKVSSDSLGGTSFTAGP